MDQTNHSALHILKGAVSSVLGIPVLSTKLVKFMSAGGLLRISYPNDLSEEQKVILYLSFAENISLLRRLSFTLQTKKLNQTNQFCCINLPAKKRS